jgi:hypothetical protein
VVGIQEVHALGVLMLLPSASRDWKTSEAKRKGNMQEGAIHDAHGRSCQPEVNPFLPFQSLGIFESKYLGLFYFLLRLHHYIVKRLSQTTPPPNYDPRPIRYDTTSGTLSD